MSKSVRALIIASAALTAGACAPQVSRQGFQPVDVLPSEIAVGVDTRDTVAQRLGTPSAVSTFEPNIWYYVSQTTERYTYLPQSVSQRSVTAIIFDEATGQVTEVRNLSLEDGQRIAYNERETPTRGRELTVLEQLLGNVGRQRLPNSDDDLPPSQRRGD